ncbi:uncharacterized protein LA080_004017 [Diaporthe eres]|nr:uncharacterized protein LA080_004017 [Diaporthe eres]
MGVEHLLTQVVAGLRYLAHPQIMGTILEDVPATTITPVVVLTLELLGSFAQKFRDFEKDDVYSTAFSQNLVILCRDGEEIDSAHLSPRAFSTVHYANANSTSDGILPGPHFLHGSGIHQAWWLHPDHLDAFIFGVIPETGIETGRINNRGYREELRVFRHWFHKNIMSHDDSSLSDAIMIMPYGSANPKSPSTSQIIGEKFISPVLQMPQLVLLFAQMPYQSRVSGRQEHRPIASTLVGAKGSDLMLVKVAQAAFDAAGWPTKIDTGRYMYPLGNNLRNVAVPQENLRSDGEKNSFLGAQAAEGQSVLRSSWLGYISNAYSFSGNLLGGWDEPATSVYPAASSISCTGPIAVAIRPLDLNGTGRRAGIDRCGFGRYMRAGPVARGAERSDGFGR